MKEFSPNCCCSPISPDWVPPHGTEQVLQTILEAKLLSPQAVQVQSPAIHTVEIPFVELGVDPLAAEAGTEADLVDDLWSGGLAGEAASCQLWPPVRTLQPDLSLLCQAPWSADQPDLSLLCQTPWSTDHEPSSPRSFHPSLQELPPCVSIVASSAPAVARAPP